MQNAKPFEKSEEEKKMEREELEKEEEDKAKAPTGPGFAFMSEEAQSKLRDNFLNKFNGESQQEEEPKVVEIEEDAVPDEPDNAPVRAPAPPKEEDQKDEQEVQ